MIKKILVIATVLLAIGVSISVYLPSYNPHNEISTKESTIHIDQDSLRKPILMSSTSLKTPMADSDLYGLQIGMYPQLTQAVTKRQTVPMLNNVIIIKVQDIKRYWFLLIQGPYKQKATAQQHNSSLSATLIRWPLPIQKQVTNTDTSTGK